MSPHIPPVGIQYRNVNRMRSLERNRLKATEDIRLELATAQKLVNDAYATGKRTEILVDCLMNLKTLLEYRETEHLDCACDESVHWI